MKHGAKWGILVVIGSLFFGDLSLGTELEYSITRNPFEYGKRKAEGTNSKHGKEGGAGSGLGVVLTKSGEMIAYINGNPVKNGDVIDGARVIGITLDYVQLRSSDKVWRIYVANERKVQ